MCTAANNQLDPNIASDNGGGAFIAWQDTRGGPTFDAYAQHLLEDGSVSPGWTPDGVVVSATTGHQGMPVVVDGGSGGAIVAWHDTRSGTFDIYAQRVDANGIPLWLANGSPVCSAANDQGNPTIVSDGAGGAIVTWQDGRSGADIDIYASPLRPFGPLGVQPIPMGGETRVTAAWPNPFNSQVRVGFILPAPMSLRLDVFDLAGRQVWASLPTLFSAGPQAFEWGGLREDGSPAAEGVYFVSVRGPGFQTTRTIVRLR